MFAQTVLWRYFKLNFLNVTSCGPMRLAVGLYTFSSGNESCWWRWGGVSDKLTGGFRICNDCVVFISNQIPFCSY